MGLIRVPPPAELQGESQAQCLTLPSELEALVGFRLAVRFNFVGFSRMSFLLLGFAREI